MLRNAFFAYGAEFCYLHGNTHSLWRSTIPIFQRWPVLSVRYIDGRISRRRANGSRCPCVGSHINTAVFVDSREHTKWKKAATVNVS